MHKKRALPHSGRTHETRRLFFNKISQKIEGLGKRTVEFIHSYEDLKKILNDNISPKIYFKDDIPVFVS